MELTLVIMAAGRGTRFGGDKPLAAVGPNGESLFEYSVRDAVGAGFTRVVFVVSLNQNTVVFSERLSSYKNRLSVDFVIQKNDTAVDSDLMRGKQRLRPWGTGHAVLVCRAVIDTPFVVINADDYYGPSSFRIIGDFLRDTVEFPDTAALPGYALKNTLSGSGGVNRGICTVTGDGYLRSICEYKNISQIKENLSWDHPHAGDSIISPDVCVSMTFWGFHPEIFSLLNTAFTDFLQITSDIENDEFYIPAAVDFAITSGLLRVKVFPSSEQWRGITYAEDVATVRSFIQSLPDNTRKSI